MNGGGRDGDSDAAVAGTSYRDGRAGRPRVQQLRPTNKDVSTSAAVGRATAPIAATSAPTSTEQVQQQNRTTGVGGARVIPRIVTGQGSGSTIIVNTTQTGNPVLKSIRNVGWEYGEIVPDYQLGVAACALFLSIRYHRLHPEYVHTRIAKLSNMYTLRVLLVHCDVEQPESAIKELTKVAIVNNLTVVLAWNQEEAATYLERFKSFENKAPDLIRERVSDDYMSHLNSALTQIRGVNKTDVITLATTFGSLKNIAQSSADDLGRCPGFADTKIRRLQEAFHQPFRVGETRTGRERRAERERMLSRDAAMESASREAAAAARADAANATGSTSVLRSDFRRPPLRGLQDEDDFETDEDRARLARRPPNVAANGAASVTRPAESDVEDEIEDADDEFGDILDDLTEEEQLQLALEMSRSAPSDD